MSMFLEKITPRVASCQEGVLAPPLGSSSPCEDSDYIVERSPIDDAGQTNLAGRSKYIIQMQCVHMEWYIGED